MTYDSLSLEQQLRLDKLCDLFEQQWNEGEHPSLGEYLGQASEDLSEDAARQLSLELLMVDMEFRWKTMPAEPDSNSVDRTLVIHTKSESFHAKRRLSLQDYAQWLELGPISQLPLEVICCDLRCRRSTGQVPIEYLDTFRHHPQFEQIAAYRETQNQNARHSQTRLSLRCPQCRESIVIDGDQSLDVVACDKCGADFNIASEQPAPLQSVHHFQILERLGVGGFGTVWKARDTKLDRFVAIKIPRSGSLSPEESEKFQREARAAAQLSHRHIVTVYEVGRDDQTPYIVSDFVDGTPLSKSMVDQPISFWRAAKLCQEIAEALDYAHSRGVIHRDLKPANILIDEAGEPHITDFGLAKREVGEATLTIDGQLLGTPAYMPPEQARGDAHVADRRSDIYSLGVILYELLTGELPFRGNVSMMLRQVLDEEPRPPRKLNHRIPRDLETICLKCMEKRPEHRYDTARELAQEFTFYLAGRPIRSRPISPARRMLRWCRRQPYVAATVALVSLIAIASPIVAWRQMKLTEELADQLSHTQLSQVKSMIAAREEGYRERVKPMLEQVYRRTPSLAPEISQAWVSALGDFAGLKSITVDLGHALEVINCIAISPKSECIALGAKSVGSGIESLFLFDMQGKELASMPLGNNAETIYFEHAEFSASTNFASLKVLSRDGTVQQHTWRSSSLKLRGEWESKGLLDVGSVYAYGAFSPNGDFVVTRNETEVCLWNLNEQRKMATITKSDLPIDGNVTSRSILSAEVSHDGKQVAVGFEYHDQGRDHTGFCLWYVDELQSPRINFSDTSFFGPALGTFALDENLFAFGSDRHVLYETETMTRRHSVTRDEVNAIAFGAHDRLLAVYYNTGEIMLRSVSTGDSKGVLRASRWEGRQSLAFSRDGAQLVATNGTNLQIWRFSLPELKVLAGHDSSVTDVDIHPDARQIASAAKSGEVIVWNTESDTQKQIDLTSDRPVQCVRFAPDGSLLAIGLWESDGVPIFDTASWLQTASVPLAGDVVTLSVLGVDSKNFVFAATRNGRLELWRLHNSVPEQQFRHDAVSDVPGAAADLYSAAISPDLRYLAWIEYRRSLASFCLLTRSLDNGVVSESMPVLGGWHGVEFCSNTDVMVVTKQGELIRWNVESEQVVEVLTNLEQTGPLTDAGVFLSQDCRYQAVVVDPRTVEVRDLTRREKPLRLRTEESQIWTAAFGPGGRYLAVGTSDGGLIRWDLAAIRESRRVFE